MITYLILNILVLIIVFGFCYIKAN